MDTIIVEWLRQHELISIFALEKKCKIPASTIWRAIKGTRGLPKKHFIPLKMELKKYGLK